MNPPAELKLIGGLLDLPILDCNGAYCGIVDDVEFAESDIGAPRVGALLVGPGAYRSRLPRWACRLIALTAGTRVTKVPWQEVDEVDAAVKLRTDGGALGLKISEDRARYYVPRKGAL